MTTPPLPGLIPPLGSFFVVLVCLLLYGQRRQSWFLVWALAWSCFSLWLLLGNADGLVLGGWPGLQPLGFVCGVLHGVLWLLGLVLFRQEKAGARAPAATPARVNPGLSSPRFVWLAVLAFVGVALLVGLVLPWPVASGLLSFVLVGIYGGSAAFFWMNSRQPAAAAPPGPTAEAGNFGALFLCLALVADAIGQGHSLGLQLLTVSGSLTPGYLQALSAADFVFLALTAAGLLALFLEEEKARLRHTLRCLAESEDHFRLVFENSGVAMASLTPAGRFLRVNAAFVRLLGYEAAELEGRRLVELAQPKDPRNGTTSSEQGLDPPTDLYERERRYLHKNGQPVWARVLRVPLRDGDGRMRFIVGVLLDITERKRAEEALAASELRYRLRFEGAFDGILCCQETGEFLDANPAFCRMLGYTFAELKGLTIADIADDPPQLSRHFASALASGGQCLETRLRRKDGSLVEIEISTAAIELDGRRVLHGISRDITERKKAEEALRRAEEVLREERDFITQVLETADALILVLGPAGDIVRYNGKCAAVSGRREDEVKGLLFWEVFVPPPFRDAARQAFHKTVDQGTALPFDSPCQPPSGEERWIAWRYTAVRDTDGWTRYVIGAGLDVTDQRRLAEQLQNAQKMETLGTLVGGIAHDFNNQLTVILGNLGLTLSDLDRAGETYRQLSDAERAAQRCADMTQGLLTFSRRRMGLLHDIELNPFVTEAVRLLQRALPPGVRLELQLDPSTGAVQVDPTQLHQVLMNLALNARDAMPQGGTLTLATSRQVLDEMACLRNVEARPGTFAALSVRDDGTGMTAEVQSRMFEPFFTTKDVGKGTGLGLSMVFGIVKAHRGWISVTSSPGKGSTFDVYLPASTTPAEQRPAAPAPPVAHGQECILIVDDEDLVRSLARTVLEQWGYRVLTAADGDEAITLYTQQRAAINLVLLDFAMPGMNGLEVLRRLQQLNPNVRVLFSSGYTNQADIDHLQAAGAQGFVPKPYRPGELVQRVREALDEDRGSRIEESTSILDPPNPRS